MKQELKEKLVDQQGKLNTLGQYALLQRAKFLFAGLIKKHGTEGSEFRTSEKNDIGLLEEEENAIKAQFNEQYKAYLSLVSEWKAANEDKFVSSLRVPNISDYIKDFDFKLPEGLTVEDAIAGYKWANQQIKEFDKTELLTSEFKSIKPEFKELYDEVKAKFSAETGYDKLDEALNAAKHPIVKTTVRLSLNRKKQEEEPKSFELIKQSYLDFVLK